VSVKAYLLSLPERFARSALGLGAGVVREAGELAIPTGIRKGQLYQNVVETTLRFLIEDVGGAEGVYRAGETLPEHFLARRTAGNVVEALGIVAFRASPVWVLAALADVCGIGRLLIPEIAESLKAQDLLEKDTEFRSVDDMLDGLERMATRMAGTINTPPLDVPALRDEWRAIREDARRLQPDHLPSRETLSGIWSQLREESTRQERTIFETSSMLALSAVRDVPDQVRWLSVSAKVGAVRTGQVFAGVILDHYRQTLSDIQQVGYATYAGRQFRPYLRAALEQFSPKRRTITERLLEKL